MRIAAQVFLGYALLLVFGAVWRLLPFEFAAPQIVALVAVYLGLNARAIAVGPVHMRIAPPTFGAVILGYLGDLLMGTPKGLIALTAGLVCIAGHVVHGRLIVRGRLMTMVFAFFTGAAAGVFALLVRSLGGLTLAGFGRETWMLFGSAVLTGLIGPVVFYLCRFIDSRFARTHRERDATLGGVSL